MQRRFSTMRYTLVLFLFICWSCGDNLQRQEVTNEAGGREVFFLDAETKTRAGDYMSYDAEGNLIEQASYTAGELNGQRTLFATTGDTLVVEHYKAGEFVGEYRSYFDTGNKLKMRGQYVDNTMSGEWTKFYDNGQIEEVVTFVNNNENGPFTEWYRDGVLKAKGNYLDGDNEHGQLLLYDANGKLIRVMNCQRGRCSTEWRDGDAEPSPPITLTH